MLSVSATNTLIALGGILIGVGAMHLLWRSATRADGPPKWLPPKLVQWCYGDVGTQITQTRRVKIASEQLQKESRELSALLNLMPFPAWRRNDALEVQYCNLAYHTLLEDVPDNVLEEHGLELTSNARFLAEEAASQREAVFERRHLVIDGQRRLYRVCEMPDSDSGGTIGFAPDITEQEYSEEELRRHIQAQADMLEASNMATAIFGADKSLKFYNSAFVSLWKLDEQWLDGEPSYGELLELLREKRRITEVVNFPLFKKQRLQLFTDLMEPQEEIAHLPDGRILRIVIIPHALGGLVFSYEDVTDRMALETSYNTLIAVQRETLDNLHEGVAVFGEDGRLKLSNPTYQKLWGLRSDFLASEPHVSEILDETRNYYHYRDWDEFKQRMIGQLHVRKMNYQRTFRSDGSVIDWSTVPLPDGATLITYFDVTDSTLVERSLIEKNEALREADKLKTEFLLSVSYELRSPLTSITGFSEMLKDNLCGKLTKQQHEYVGSIYGAATQLEQLINNILDLASIEAGYMRLDISECDIYELVEDTFSLLTERAKDAGITLKLECKKRLGSFQADEARIKQVVFNLLNNAVKFTESGGKVKLGAEIDENDTVVIWVKDTGRGIPEEDLSSVFERFRAGTVRTHRSGAGLGLAMVKNFVELHGGRVELESEVGKGTTVTCYLPRQHPADYTAQRGRSGSPLAQESDTPQA